MASMIVSNAKKEGGVRSIGRANGVPTNNDLRAQDEISHANEQMQSQPSRKCQILTG
jgi:hypothetical protein